MHSLLLCGEMVVPPALSRFKNEQFEHLLLDNSATEWLGFVLARLWQYDTHHDKGAMICYVAIYCDSILFLKIIKF